MKEKFRLLINRECFLNRAAITSDNHIEYLFVNRPDVLSVGNIYKGKVERVITGLNAAFVNIGEFKNGFLPFEKEDTIYQSYEVEEHTLKSMKKPYRTGEDIIVQITRPGTAEKGVKLTTKISLPGRFLILIPDSNLRTISKKIIDRKERERLLSIANRRITGNTGFIIRTASEGKDERYIVREIKILLSTWNRIRRYAKVKRAPSLLWGELPLYINVIRDYVTSEFKEIIVDDEKTYKEIKRYVSHFIPEIYGKLILYKNDEGPLFMKYGVEKEIEGFLSDRIFLPSGGSLIIEEGETLTAIDVNTGSSEKKSFRDTIFITNMEAAEEIPRQIRGRNLAGLIVVDFIDMKDPKERSKVFKTLNENLEIDKAKTSILSISKLGVVEMSREKTDFRLSDILMDVCSKCNGRGYIKNVYYSALKFKNEVLSYLVKNPEKKISVEVSESLYDFIYREGHLYEIIRKYNITCRESKILRDYEFKII
ncbi:MAG: Rne/Rng family ribonuclease [Candidatus Omnitrophica bacterium]|nr:Rne/Rng family ribonuclease [Candidatus Omnitrophota bacterium]